MNIALLNITGICLAASLVVYRTLFSRSRRSQSLLDRGVGNQREANFLSREHPVATRQPHSGSLPAKKRIAVRGLTKAEAEDVLDLLESRGQAGTLIYVEGEGFAVQ